MGITIVIVATLALLAAGVALGTSDLLDDVKAKIPGLREDAPSERSHLSKSLFPDDQYVNSGAKQPSASSSRLTRYETLLASLAPAEQAQLEKAAQRGRNYLELVTK